MISQIINRDEQINVVKEQNQNNLEHVSFIVLGFTSLITEYETRAERTGSASVKAMVKQNIVQKILKNLLIKFGFFMKIWNISYGTYPMLRLNSEWSISKNKRNSYIG